MKSRNMGCGHLWDDNLIVYGCGKGDPNYWTIDTSDTSALVEGSTSGACGFPAALNFRNIDNSTLIATGNTKNIYQFTSVDGTDLFIVTSGRSICVVWAPFLWFRNKLLFYLQNGL